MPQQEVLGRSWYPLLCTLYLLPCPPALTLALYLLLLPLYLEQPWTQMPKQEVLLVKDADASAAGPWTFLVPSTLYPLPLHCPLPSTLVPGTTADVDAKAGGPAASVAPPAFDAGASRLTCF